VRSPPFTNSLIISVGVPNAEPSIHSFFLSISVPQCGALCSLFIHFICQSPQCGALRSLIHSLYLSESPIRSPPTKNWKNIWSPSTETHVDRRPTYNGVQPGSPRGTLMALLSLPQCHAAFSTIPSTLAWVDQSTVSQHVS
jgi:hypothetical protein